VIGDDVAQVIEKNLVRHLADGQFHSGQKLADALGISRTAIWKQFKKLEMLGLSVEVQRGKGYRLPGGIELLDRKKILDAVPSQARPMISGLMVLDEIDSTNRQISSLPESERHGAICMAEMQSAGRGRRGRSWSSPFGRNIYLSLGWQFEGGAASLEGLSLAVGVAVCRALTTDDSVSAPTSEALQLKWPNDILYMGRKLGGVLVEVQGDLSGDCYVTIGVGLNHRMAGAAIDTIGQPWADVSEVSSVSRNTLAAALIGALIAMIQIFESNGFSAFKEEWSGYDGYKDKAVTVQTVTTSIAGICRGIAHNGALLVETGSGRETFNGGEVSLRVQS